MPWGAVDATAEGSEAVPGVQVGAEHGGGLVTGGAVAVGPALGTGGGTIAAEAGAALRPTVRGRGGDSKSECP